MSEPHWKGPGEGYGARRDLLLRPRGAQQRWGTAGWFPRKLATSTAERFTVPAAVVCVLLLCLRVRAAAGRQVGKAVQKTLVCKKRDGLLRAAKRDGNVG